MKVLSIKPIWAVAIFYFGKDIENRTWATYHRGDLLIHVSNKKPSKKEITGFCEWYCHRFNKVIIAEEVAELCEQLLGSIVGIVQLADCSQSVKSKWAEPNQYHWCFKNPRLLASFSKEKGQLGLWNAPKKLTEMIELI